MHTPSSRYLCTTLGTSYRGRHCVYMCKVPTVQRYSGTAENPCPGWLGRQIHSPLSTTPPDPNPCLLFSSTSRRPYPRLPRRGQPSRSSSNNNRAEENREPSGPGKLAGPISCHPRWQTGARLSRQPLTISIRHSKQLDGRINRGGAFLGRYLIGQGVPTEVPTLYIGCLP